jgi:hypothetical protein
VIFAITLVNSLVAMMTGKEDTGSFLPAPAHPPDLCAVTKSACVSSPFIPPHTPETFTEGIGKQSTEIWCLEKARIMSVAQHALFERERLQVCVCVYIPTTLLHI